MSDRLNACDHILAFALEHPWAVTQPMLAVIAGILSRRIAGLSASETEIAAALVNRKNLPQPVEGGSVAIIPIYGVIAPRMNMLSDFSGGTTFEGLSKSLGEAMANKAVKTILFDVDSPGGSVAGATEFARDVMKARTKKPIVAVGQYTLASAAYWAVAGATEIVAAPSASVGSIGVLAIHNDLSEALKQLGIKRTFITSAKYKADGNETEPLSKETLARIQSRIDEADASFCADISRGRGTAIADLRKQYGDGQVFSAAEALSRGMIDKVATLDETLARLLASPPSTSQPSATDTTQEPAAHAAATVQDRRLIDAQRHELEMLSL